MIVVAAVLYLAMRKDGDGSNPAGQAAKPGGPGVGTRTAGPEDADRIRRRIPGTWEWLDYESEKARHTQEALYKLKGLAPPRFRAPLGITGDRLHGNIPYRVVAIGGGGIVLQVEFDGTPDSYPVDLSPDGQELTIHTDGIEHAPERPLGGRYRRQSAGDRR